MMLERATPAAARTDSIYLQVNDPNAGGAAGSNFAFVYVVSGSPVPNDAVILATIARATTESSIANAVIVDKRPLGEWSWTVSTSAPTGVGVPGDLWVQC